MSAELLICPDCKIAIDTTGWAICAAIPPDTAPRLCADCNLARLKRLQAQADRQAARAERIEEAAKDMLDALQAQTQGFAVLSHHARVAVGDLISAVDWYPR